MPNKVYIVGGDGAIQRMFERAGWEVVADALQADVFQFTGGSDVSPFLYGEKNHRTTGNDPRRDLIEMGYYQLAHMLGKPCIGICRGGQFLNVMNGGKMWQHVNGHAIHGTHVAYVIGVDGDVIDEVQVTSTHHQMMREGERGAVLVRANEATWLENDTIKTKADPGYPDVECVWYPDTNSLCFQPHPEYGVQSCTDLYFQLIERTIGLK
jgi:hypothetical protein